MPAPLAAASPSMRAACAEAMTDLGRLHPALVALGADGRSVFTGFAAAFPERYLDVGVAEANLVGVAAGLARCGVPVVVGAMAPFLLRRAYEQLRLDLCLPRLPATLLGVGGGLSYGTLGPSHHAADDVALSTALPNTTVFCPLDGAEARRILAQAVPPAGVTYIRLGAREDPPVLADDDDRDPRLPRLLRQGPDALVLATGRCVAEALAAADDLERRGVEVSVASLSCLKPFPAEPLRRLCQRFRHVVTVEEAQESGGLGQQTALHARPNRGGLQRLHVDLRTPPTATREALLGFYGIDRRGVVAAVLGRRAGSGPP
jgi:transketolase